MATIVWLPVPPLPEAASVLGHHQHDAVSADAKVMDSADALYVAQALHDGNLPECSYLCSRRSLNQHSAHSMAE